MPVSATLRTSAIPARGGGGTAHAGRFPCLARGNRGFAGGGVGVRPAPEPAGLPGTSAPVRRHGGHRHGDRHVLRLRRRDRGQPALVRDPDARPVRRLLLDLPRAGVGADRLDLPRWSTVAGDPRRIRNTPAPPADRLRRLCRRRPERRRRQRGRRVAERGRPDRRRLRRAPCGGRPLRLRHRHRDRRRHADRVAAHVRRGPDARPRRHPLGLRDAEFPAR